MGEEEITRWNHDVPNWEGSIEKLLFRETKEESGVTVTDPRYLMSVAFVRPDGIPVICAKFGVRYSGGEVSPAPEFDDFAWVHGDEIKKYDIVKGIDQEIRETARIYSS